MSLALVLLDEMNGFYRSRLMTVLWGGLPIMAILLYFLVPEDSLAGIPFTIFASLLVGSIGALLASVMLAVNLVNEINDHSLELFLVRPVKRWHLLASKLAAVYLCVTVACLLALAVGIGVDVLFNGTSLEAATVGLGDSLVTTMLMMGISCSAALLIAIFSPSVLIAVILVIFGANQLSALVILPVMVSEFSTAMTVAVSTILCLVMLALAVFAFQRREV